MKTVDADTSPDPAAVGPDTHDDAELAARLRVALGRLHRRLLRQPGAEVSFAQLSALVMVEKYEPIRVGDLAQREQVAAPSMTRTLAGLVSAGWVRRHPDPDDGRSFTVTMTPDGHRLIARVRQQRTAALAQGMERLTVKQLAALRVAIPVLELLADEAEEPKP